MGAGSRDTDHDTHQARRGLPRHRAADAEAARLGAEASICHSEKPKMVRCGPTVRPRGAVSTGTERSAALLSRKKIRAAAAYREVYLSHRAAPPRNETRDFGAMHATHIQRCMPLACEAPLCLLNCIPQPPAVRGLFLCVVFRGCASGPTRSDAPD